MAVTTITVAAADDIPFILTCIRDLAAFERLAHEVVATEARLQDALCGPRPLAHAVIARVDGAPVGFALWFYNFSTFTGLPGLYLEDLYVQPAWRRQGIGRALLTHLAATAVAQGCARMEWSVLDWNADAIAVYRALGAVPMDDWTVQRLTGDALRACASGAATAPPRSAP